MQGLLPITLVFALCKLRMLSRASHSCAVHNVLQVAQHAVREMLHAQG